MGVVQKLQASRLASQLAFMMIEYIRRAGDGDYGTKRAEVGWILEDNQGMVAIADAIGSQGQPRIPDLCQGPVDAAAAARGTVLSLRPVGKSGRDRRPARD